MSGLRGSAGWLLLGLFGGCAPAAETCSMALVSLVPMHLAMDGTKLAVPVMLDGVKQTLIVDANGRRASAPH